MARPSTPDLAIRTYCGEEDVRAIASLYSTAAEADGPEYGRSEEEMHQALTGPTVMPEENAFLFEVGGQLVAYSHATLEDGLEESVFLLRGLVHPDWRRRGIGTRVIQRLEKRVRERLGEARNQTVTIDLMAELNHQDRHALFRKMGYEPVRYFFRMECPLREGGTAVPLPAPAYPPGSVVRSMAERSDLRAVSQATDEAFQGQWGHTEIALEQWQHWTSDPDYHPELWLAAWDTEQDRVAGVCLNSVEPGHNARVGRQEGWIHVLAVRQPYRGQGLGRALLLAGMRALQKQGMSWAMLGVDTENVTGALHLYESAGFRPVKRFAAFRKRVRS
jgi:mycothiol synthase